MSARRILKRAGQGAAVALLAVIAFGIGDAWQAFGKRAEGARKARMSASKQWLASAFENPQPLWNDYGIGMWKAVLFNSAVVSPQEPIRVVTDIGKRLATPPTTGLRVTWLGHSTMVLEIDGRRVLTDPVWGERASPLTWVGPMRYYAPPLPFDELPPIDVVVISHDHYDHLDMPTIVAMRGWKDTKLVVPLGVGAHLAYWGIPDDRIVEVDWWDHVQVNGLDVVCVPARHASGRALVDNNATLWSGFAFLGEKHRAYYSGDTGLFPALDDIGAQLGPFDLTMIESGAYNAAWPDWHLGPEQAVDAHRRVRGKVLMPVHWGLFNLAPHAWTEPAERVLVAAAKIGANVVIPRPGGSFEPEDMPPFERWWPKVPWRTAEEDPIRSTKMDAPR